MPGYDQTRLPILNNVSKMPFDGHFDLGVNLQCKKQVIIIK